MQLSKDSSVGFLATLSALMEKEGAAGLFKGLKPALLRQASYQGIKMFLYEPIRDAVLAATTKEGEENAQPKLWQMILAGGLAGAIGTYITSPTDLVKIRMQSGVAYDGVLDAFASVGSAASPAHTHARCSQQPSLNVRSLARPRRLRRLTASCRSGTAGHQMCSARSSSTPLS